MQSRRLPDLQLRGSGNLDLVDQDDEDDEPMGEDVVMAVSLSEWDGRCKGTLETHAPPILIALSTFFIIFVSFRARRSWYPAAGLEALGSYSSQCANLYYLPYKPHTLGQDWVPNLPMGIHAFVFVSAFRMKAQQFAILGFGALVLRSEWGQRQEGCVWISKDGPSAIQGTLSYLFPEEHHDFLYEVVIIHCTLQEATSASAGGSLFFNVHGEDVMAYEEEAGMRRIDPVGPYDHHLTFCSNTLIDHIRPARVAEYLSYTQYLGADHFVLYDGGAVDGEVRKVVEPFLVANVLQIVDMRQMYRFPNFPGVFSTNECAYRNSFSSKWIVTLSLDEYLFLETPQSIGELLHKHEGKPWVSFGMYRFSVTLCRPETGCLSTKLFVKQSDPCRLGLPPLANRAHGVPLALPILCGGERVRAVLPPPLVPRLVRGRRFFADPRQLRVTQIHWVVDPRGGVEMPTDAIRIMEYEGLSKMGVRVCEDQISTGEVEWWALDESFSSYVQRKRASGQIVTPNVY